MLSNRPPDKSYNYQTIPDILTGIPVYGSPAVPYGYVIAMDKTAGFRGFHVNDLIIWIWKMKKATVPDAGHEHYSEDLAAILGA